ncbi:MAG: cupin-like domain-containing protein [Pseudomonadota bacterium]
MLNTRPTPRLDTLDSATFVREFKAPAKPVVLEGLTRDWPARQRWSAAYFRQVAGNRVVPLYDSKPATDHKHQHAAATEMPLSDYLDRLEAGENDLRLFFFNLLSEAPELAEDFHFPEIGLKLFKKLPVLFMGGRGAKVQMHFDIDWSDILLCHFGGKKRVLLFPPEQTRYMYHVPFSFSSLFGVDYDNPDYDRYPALKQLEGEVAELNHGDVLYIPPGYWHYIVYEEIGYSMALRAFPRTPANTARMLNNLLLVRTTEGLMRKLIGQRWNDRNERRAVERTHRRLTNALVG